MSSIDKKVFENILLGKAVLICGAGAAYGMKNVFLIS